MDTRSYQRLAGFHKIEKGKTITQSKVTWNNQAGIFIAKEKVEVIGLKIPQLDWKGEVTAILHLLGNLIITVLTLS